MDVITAWNGSGAQRGAAGGGGCKQTLWHQRSSVWCVCVCVHVRVCVCVCVLARRKCVLVHVSVRALSLRAKLIKVRMCASQL